MTHICVSKLTSIGSDNGLSPGRRQAIIWTNAGILFIGPLGTNCNETSIETHTFSFKKIHLKISSAKWRPFCLGLNVLRPANNHPIYSGSGGVFNVASTVSVESNSGVWYLGFFIIICYALISIDALKIQYTDVYLVLSSLRNVDGWIFEKQFYLLVFLYNKVGNEISVCGAGCERVNIQYSTRPGEVKARTYKRYNVRCRIQCLQLQWDITVGVVIRFTSPGVRNQRDVTVP